MNLLVKKEYFDLVNKLNLSNKVRNQITDVYFYIDETDPETAKLFAAISNTQKILLCEKGIAAFWWPTYLSGFSNLEEYICDILKNYKRENSLTNLIRSHIFKLE